MASTHCLLNLIVQMKLWHLNLKLSWWYSLWDRLGNVMHALCRFFNSSQLDRDRPLNSRLIYIDHVISLFIYLNKSIQSVTFLSFAGQRGWAIKSKFPLYSLGCFLVWVPFSSLFGFIPCCHGGTSMDLWS